MPNISLFFANSLSLSVLTECGEVTVNSVILLMSRHLVNDDTEPSVSSSSEMAALQRVGLLSHPVMSNQVSQLVLELSRLTFLTIYEHFLEPCL